MVITNDKKAVFIDRDGVINKAIVKNGKPYSPINFNEFIVLPQVSEALNLLKRLNYVNIIVTNQPDIKSGKQSIEDLSFTHKWILKNLSIDAIYSCHHDNQDNCLSRKPNIGMLNKASKELGINIKKSYMIGDRWKDIKCGQLANCKQIFFIDYGYKEKLPDLPFTKVKSLFMLSKIIESYGVIH